MKAVVVACNTATAAGLDELRAELPVPVIDVIEPGARALVTATSVGPRRRDRHRRHDLVGRVPSTPIARTGAPVSSDERRVSRVSSSSSNAARRPATR